MIFALALAVAGGVLVAFAVGILAVLLVALWDYLRGSRVAYAPTALICVAVGAGGTTAIMFALYYGAARVLA